MSTLLLDIGNSRLKWALQADADAPIPAAQAIAHAGAPASALAALAAQWQGAAPQAVCIAHVTGSAHEAALVQAVQQAWHCTPRIARSRSECAGLKSAYADGSRLGVDRWLAMLALWTRQPAAFAVASAGTALTFDAVDASGQHQGGVIAPGLSAMIETTLGHTRFAVGEMAAAFERGLGRDTEACVRQGGLHAAAGLLDRLGAQHPGSKHLAGGDALTLQAHLQGRWQIEADLVLQGLAAWARLASVG
ncbi:MAG: type III pantothenate kinase [Pseudomonadota bacterium]